jgi:hypothetical protein
MKKIKIMKMTTKEEILEALKDLVLGLMKNPEKLKDNIIYQASWVNRQQEIGIAVKTLNSCDTLWLNDEYGAWFKAEIKPNIKDIDPSIKDKLIWK